MYLQKVLYKLSSKQNDRRETQAHPNGLLVIFYFKFDFDEVFFLRFLMKFHNLNKGVYFLHPFNYMLGLGCTQSNPLNEYNAC